MLGQPILQICLRGNSENDIEKEAQLITTVRKRGKAPKRSQRFSGAELYGHYGSFRVGLMGQLL